MSRRRGWTSASDLKLRKNVLNINLIKKNAQCECLSKSARDGSRKEKEGQLFLMIRWGLYFIQEDVFFLF